MKTGQYCPAGNETGKGKPWTRPYSCNRGLSEEEEKKEEEEEEESSGWARSDDIPYILTSKEDNPLENVDDDDTKVK